MLALVHLAISFTSNLVLPMIAANVPADSSISLFDILAENIAVGVFFVDAELRIVRWNEWFRKFVGLQADEFANRPLAEVFPLFSEQRLDAMYAEVMETRQSRILSSTLYPGVFDLAGSRREGCRIRLIPVATGDFPARGVITMVEDISEQRRPGAHYPVADPGESQACATAEQIREFQRELDHLTEELASARLRIDLICSLSERLAQVTDLKEIAEIILDEILQQVPAGKASFMLLDDACQELSIVASRGLPPLVSGFLAVKLSESVVEDVIARGSPLLINDLRDHHRLYARIKGSYYETYSMVSVPLLVNRGSAGREVLGVINLADKLDGKGYFTVQDRMLLSTVACHAAVAVKKTHLFDDLNRSIQEKEEAFFYNQLIMKQSEQILAVNRILHKLSKTLTVDEVCMAICSGLRSEMDIRRIVLALRGERGGFGVVRSLGVSELNIEEVSRELAMDRACLAVLNTGRKLWKVDFEGATSICDRLFCDWTVWPLKSRRDTLGVLILDAPGPDKRDSLAIFINQAGIFLDNVLLFESMIAANEQLMTARDTAEAASRAKSDFLANMSHELRTPLNAIIGFTELILDLKFGDLNSLQEEYLGDVLQSARHLLSLINDILDLSKVEAGRLELELTEVDLQYVLLGSLVMIKERAMKHGIQLSTDLDLFPSTIIADERKLKQILYNLLSNAVKFTPDGGNVRLAARLTDQIEITVADTGIGIRQEDMERIFNPFEQVDGSVSRKYVGTGLGLTLTRRLVELHGGKIWVESRGDGKGSTFHFTIPHYRPLSLQQETTVNDEQ